jgi:hypothetical protein
MRIFFRLCEAGLYADFGSDLRQVPFVCGFPVPTLKMFKRISENPCFLRYSKQLQALSMQMHTNPPHYPKQPPFSYQTTISGPV